MKPGLKIFFHSHFAWILFGPVCLLDIHVILGENSVYLKTVQNVISMNESQEIGEPRKAFVVAVGRMSRADKRYVSAICDVVALSTLDARGDNPVQYR